MALTVPCLTTRVITVDEYIDYVRREVDVRDIESVAASASMLSALANDPELVVRELNKQVKKEFKPGLVGSAQVILIGLGPDFYVRANIWPSRADIAAGRIYQDQFSYDVAHDHNYNFMTVGYLGPGYFTDIYEYDREKLEGRSGEPVEFRFLERTLFAGGCAMLYRACKDAHIQYPPEDLSITLNLMINEPDVRARDQYFFDMETRTISDFPAAQDGSRRTAIVSMAGLAGNDETRQLLTDLSAQHSCRRTRLTAFEALARLMPESEASIWERACDDPERLVSKTARERLKALTG